MIGKVADLAKFFYTQRVRGFDAPGDEPFMDPEGISRFKQELAKAAGYLEFGSGGTTVLADRAGVHSLSVENDRFYAKAVKSRLNSGKVTQVVVDTGPTREWGFPLFPSLQRAWSYVSAPFRTAPFPDFILIDGRWRVACALEAAASAHYCRREATLMFDDYAERPHYRAVEEYLGKPEMAGRAAIFRIGGPVSREGVFRALADPR